MKKSLSILILLISISCGKENNSNNDATMIWGISSQEEAYNLLGDYAHFIFTEASGLTLRSKLSPREFISIPSAYYRTDKQSELADGGSYFIGDVEFVFQEDVALYLPIGYTAPLTDEELTNIMIPFLGTTQNFRLVRAGNTIFSKNIYIPEQIDVNINLAQHEVTGYYEIDKNSNLDISWNADANNENGVLMIITWTGHVYGTQPQDIEYKYEQKAVLAETDDGHYSIPSSMFEDVPENALFQIKFVRGSLEKAYIDDTEEGFQVYSISENIQHFIVKE